MMMTSLLMIPGSPPCRRRPGRTRHPSRTHHCSRSAACGGRVGKQLMIAVSPQREGLEAIAALPPGPEACTVTPLAAAGCTETPQRSAGALDRTTSGCDLSWCNQSRDSVCRREMVWLLARKDNHTSLLLVLLQQPIPTRVAPGAGVYSRCRGVTMTPHHNPPKTSWAEGEAAN